MRYGVSKPVESIISSSGMLPNAVLPPSLDHNYAQWQEREDSGHTEQPPLMKKIIPAPKPKGPGEPDSPTPLHPPTPPALSKDVSDRLGNLSLISSRIRNFQMTLDRNKIVLFPSLGMVTRNL